MAQVRAGPNAEEINELRNDDLSQEGITYESQCLFVRTLNVTLKDNIWSKLASEFGDILVDYLLLAQNSHALGGSSSRYLSQSSSNTANHSGALATVFHTSGNRAVLSSNVCPATSALVGHPSTVLNAMLLKLNPSARLAITEDKDWISVMNKMRFFFKGTWF